MDISLLFLVIGLGALTFCSGYFSGSETALFSLSQTKIKTYQTDPDPRKQLIASLLKSPRDLLVTVFMMNTLVNILLQNVSSSMFGAEAGWDLKVGVPLFLTLIFGEIIPKNLGLLSNESVAYFVAPSISKMQNWIKPIRKLTVDVTDPISRFLFFFLKKEESISKEELQHVLKTSEEHGVLHPDEAELVGGYLHLQDVSVKELMRPKEDIISYDIQDPLKKLTYLFVDQECTRLPVFEKDIDNIVGMITAKQFFLLRDRITSSKELAKVLSKPLYVPETTLAHKLLRRFNDTGEVISVVVDEYGSVTGIISREDLAEVVIGKITDRRDEKSLYTRAGDREIIASGKLEIGELSDLFDVKVESQAGMLTVGGWLTEQVGDIPKTGTKHRTQNLLFQVLAACPNRVRRLYIRKMTLDHDSEKPETLEEL